MNSNFTSIRKEVISLLRKDLPHKIEVRSSQIGHESAGYGVFANQLIKKGEGLCLYPGQYTPPVPDSLTIESSLYGVEPIVFKDSPTSLSQNAYILNLESLGGYIDGKPSSDDINNNNNNRHTTNTYAVGNLINHPTHGRPNVTICPFSWRNIVDKLQTDEEMISSTVCVNEKLETNDDDEQQKEYEMIKYSQSCEYHPLPNYIREDGSPWYLCPITEEIIHHPSSPTTPPPFDNTNNASCLKKVMNHPSIYGNLAGALVVSNSDIDQGEELLLDYDLKEPLPKWAQGWYKPC